MATAARQFEAKPAKREHTPLLIGLTGPSGGGKTYSALRLATGIQQEVGGDIYFIDTESRRALHYADSFKFKHIDFRAPYGSLDYLAALQFAVNDGAKVVIVDSMSHEHEGPGGMVDLHDKIVDRMAGDDYAKRERVKMLAWSEPKQKRRALINGILQLNANFIFCFRAKNTSKPVKGKNGKTEVEQLGYMPIAGEEFVFEQTLNCLLPPGAGGVPMWHSEERGEQTMIKLPEQFRFLAGRNSPLDEKIGASLARWAAGKEKTTAKERSELGKLVDEAEEITGISVPKSPAESRQFEAQDTGPAEEPAEEPSGEQAVDEPDDLTPAEKSVASVKAQLGEAKDAKAVEKIIKDAKPHLPFLADDLQMSLEVAFSQARARFEQPETAGAK